MPGSGHALQDPCQPRPSSNGAGSSRTSRFGCDAKGHNVTRFPGQKVTKIVRPNGSVRPGDKKKRPRKRPLDCGPGGAAYAATLSARAIAIPHQRLPANCSTLRG
jgi:hypothetical protein